MFDESKHPRSEDGRFTDGNGEGKRYPQNTSYADILSDDMREGNNDNQPSLEEILGQEYKGYKGQAAIDKLLQEKHGYIKGAFHRDDIGDIDLLWGSDTLGLQHIIKQREAQGININEFLGSISDTIEKGVYFAKTNRGDFEFINNGKIAVIAIEYHGSKITYLLTAFKTRKKAPHKSDA